MNVSISAHASVIYDLTDDDPYSVFNMDCTYADFVAEDDDVFENIDINLPDSHYKSAIMHLIQTIMNEEDSQNVTLVETGEDKIKQELYVTISVNRNRYYIYYHEILHKAFANKSAGYELEDEQEDIIKIPGQNSETERREIISYATWWIDKGVEYSNAKRESIKTHDPYNSSTDCSYFTYEVYGKLGYKLGLTAEAQREDGELVGTGKEALLKAIPWDLVCYSSRWTSSGNYWGHVGIYLGGNKVVHIGGSDGVHVSDADYREIHSVRRIVEE